MYLKKSTPSTRLPNLLSQLDVPSDWYSGGCGFDLQSGHISFVEIWSQNNFYGHSFPTADSSGQLSVTGESLGTLYWLTA